MIRLNYEDESRVLCPRKRVITINLTKGNGEYISLGVLKNSKKNERPNARWPRARTDGPSDIYPDGNEIYRSWDTNVFIYENGNVVMTKFKLKGKCFIFDGILTFSDPVLKETDGTI